MAFYFKWLANMVKYQADDGGQGTGEGGNGGEPKTDSTPKITEEQVQQRISEELEKQKAEIEQKVRKEIEENQKLTDTEKFEKEKAEFEKQKQEFEKTRQEQIKALNVEKVKGIYLKAGIKEELANKLVEKVGLEYDSESKSANEIVKLFNKALEEQKTKLLADLQKNQPTPTKSPSGVEENNFFSKYNERENDKKAKKNKYF